MSEKKNISVIILEILKKHSSYEKRLKKSDIQRLLKDEYGRETDPRTIKSSLESLIGLGYPIGSTVMDRYGARSNWYYIRTYTDEQVTNLILGVKASEHLSDNEKTALINKIKDETITSSCAERVHTSKLDSSTQKNINKSLYAIYKAIDDKYMVSFSILSYINDEKKFFEEANGRITEYLVKPISVIMSGISLYLFGELADTGMYRYFPINKLYALKQTNIAFEGKQIRIPLPRNKLESYSMRFGERENATLLIDKSLLSHVFEALGDTCSIRCVYGDKTELEVNANFKLLKAFVMSLGSEAEVLSPTKLRRSIALEIKTLSAKYGEVKRLRGHL